MRTIIIGDGLGGSCLADEATGCSNWTRPEIRLVTFDEVGAGDGRQPFWGEFNGRQIRDLFKTGK